MIDYKGFAAYICDPTTYDNITKLGNIELSFMSQTGNISSATYTGELPGSDPQTAVSNMQSHIDEKISDRNQIAAVTSNANDLSGWATDYLRQIIPTTIGYDISNYLRDKIKLVSTNGSYAISAGVIAQGSRNNYGLNSTTFTCYDKNNNVVGNLALDIFSYPVGVVALKFYALNGYSGTISASTWNVYTLVASDTSTETGTSLSISRSASLVISADVANWLNNITRIIDDPYLPGGDTGDDSTGGTGGTGTFDGTSDDIDFPSLPTLSATDTGFITIFNPSVAQLQALANYMWSSGFDLDTFKKLFADPMDCILGLSIVPVNVPSGGSSTVSVGNISTGVSMPKASTQYVEIDCGTLNIEEYWGAYLDYDPYTKAELYLPYIGTHAIAVDDIMGKSVHIKYHIDILSGACAAYVKCGGSVLYTFIGQCTSSIPITGNDWTNVINGVLSIAGSIGTMVATGGASAPLAVPALASTAVNGMKPTVEKSGSMSGTGGMLGIQTPYLILTRPRQALPQAQNEFMGYPSFITRTLSSLTGYTEFESIHLNGISATENEISEIESLLKSGVIF